jgi:hypothetical protein
MAPENGARTYPSPPSSVNHNMSAKSDPRVETAVTKYYYRRALDWREMLPAIGAGLAAGAVVWYAAMVKTQRTPLVPDADPRPSRTPSRTRKPSRTPLRGARSG